MFPELLGHHQGLFVRHIRVLGSVNHERGRVFIRDVLDGHVGEKLLRLGMRIES
jgi:hypothetical protein